MFSPPNPASYNAAVYEIVATIPPGRVTTYGMIARLMPPPTGVDPDQYRRLGARWVGTAMANAPDHVPWQRVINAKGEISPRPGATLQRDLLEGEGVRFDNDQVNLKEFGWPDDAQW